MRAKVLLALAAALPVAALLSIGYAWHGLQRWLDAPLDIAAEHVVELRPGANLTTFLGDLHAEGSLDHPDWLRFYARVSGVADSVRAGEYRIEAGLTPRELLRRLVEGLVVEYSVTLVEGMTVAQLLERLHAQAKLERRILSPEADALQAALGIESAHGSAEGLFFPDTYRYHGGMSDADLLRVAHERMQVVLNEEWDKRGPDLPYKEPYDALIMASLIEKETGLAEERSQIAGVFVRRLERGMRLQTDPTVIYGLGPGFDGNLTREHLRQPGDYNTYLNPGLPPTPIAIPGRAAIVAALNPAPGDALYFVARGDGSHEFSATLEQHRKAVRRYQIQRRSPGYRSSPAGSDGDAAREGRVKDAG
jgi:UPF0755 protein